MVYNLAVKHKLVLLFLSLSVKSLAVEDKKGSKINFTERARIDAYNITSAQDHPYAVLLITTPGPKGNGLCSGTLLTMEWVLTAAHCVYNEGQKASGITVYAGVDSLPISWAELFSEGTQIVQSRKILVNPKHDKRNPISYDTALIKVKGLKRTRFVNSIEISTLPWTKNHYISCKVTGFGRLTDQENHKEDHRRKTQTLLIKKPCKCEQWLDILFGSRDVDNWLCSKPMEDYGLCSGDSGGGLVCDEKLAGVASFIISAKNFKSCDFDISRPSCGSKDTMSIFIGACREVTWVYSVIGLDSLQISPSCRDSVGLVKLCFPTLVIPFLICSIRL